MTPIRSRDLVMLAMSLVLMAMECSAVRMDLSKIFRQSRNRNNMPSEKRVSGGNPCQEPDKPWPCLGTKTCIPMRYLCDENYDCEDGSDENVEMCTAKIRPPVDDIVSFLHSQKNWIIPNLFADHDINEVAHGLAVSQTVDDFRRRIKMSSKEAKNLYRALKDIKKGDEEDMERYNMPKSAWNEVNFFFARLIKAGFA